MLTPILPYVVPTAFNDAIDHAGLQTSLTWVVDAGDSRQVSSAASGGPQTLGILPSGGSVTWWRGNDSGVDANRDPTFVGNPGWQSSNEYWSMYFPNDGVTPGGRLGSVRAAWSNAMHQNNALFTIAVWIRIDPAVGDCFILNSFFTSATGVGVQFLIPSPSAGAFGTPGKLSFNVNNGGGGGPVSAYGSSANSLTVISGAPTFYALSLNEAGNTATYAINNTQETVACTYSSPSAANHEAATISLTCGRNGTVDTGVVNTGRLYSGAFWTRALSTTELTLLYNTTKAKYGL